MAVSVSEDRDMYSSTLIKHLPTYLATWLADHFVTDYIHLFNVTLHEIVLCPKMIFFAKIKLSST